jgi:hypothetical protein
MKLYPSLSPHLATWASSQPVFLVATSPTHGAHVNVSPKGLSSHLAIFSDTQIAYIDRTGSGCETISHIYENGRLTFMFMSFGAAPRIMRIFCKGRTVEHTSPEFEGLVKKIINSTQPNSGNGAVGDSPAPGEVEKRERELMAAARAVVIGEIFQVQTSCGFGVPMVRKEFYSSKTGDVERGLDGEDLDVDLLCRELNVFEERPTLDNHSRKVVADNKLRQYQAAKNARSIDGLPGLTAARKDAGEWVWLGDLTARIAKVRQEKTSVLVGFLLGVGMYFAGNVVRGQVSLG